MTEISGWTIYLITRADALHTLFNIVGIVGLVALLPAVLAAPCAHDCFDVEPGQTMAVLKKFLKPYLIVMLTAVAVKMLVPTSTELAAIIVIPPIANNQDVRALGTEIPKLALDWLKEIKSPPKDLKYFGPKE